MRKLFLSATFFALLGAHFGCQMFVKPEKVAEKVEEYVKQLVFKLEKIEARPRVEVPLSRSGLDVDIILGIENPTDARINVKSFAGQLSIEQQSKILPVGGVISGDTLSIPPGGKGNISIVLRFNYEEIKNSWKAITNVVMGHAATWILKGNLDVVAVGRTFSVPIEITRPVNTTRANDRTESSGVIAITNE